MMEKKLGLTRATLKNIACISMLCDHIGYFLLYPMLQTSAPGTLSVLVSVLRLIGRLAFPMFAFFLAEGMHYTKSRSRYLLRLAALFAVSEVPYDLVSTGRAYAIESQNVLCSLILAGVCICLYDLICEKVSGNILLRNSLAAAVCIACMAICLVLRAEYALPTAALALIFYIYRFQSVKLISYGAIAILAAPILTAVFMPVVDGSSLFSVQKALDDCLFQLPAVLALPLLTQSGGSRGRELPAAIYYLFYPCHLLLIFFTSVIFA